MIVIFNIIILAIDNCDKKLHKYRNKLRVVLSFLAKRAKA